MFRQRDTHIPLWFALLSIAVWLLGSAHLSAADLRTWSDASGKFKIQGKFVSNDKGKITLEKPDGTEMEIELKKLSSADQKWVADYEKNAADNPFKSKEEDPFKSKPGTSKTAPGRTTPEKTMPEKNNKPARGSAASLIVPDFSDVKTILIAQPDEPWKFEVPAATPTAARPKPKLIPTPKKQDFFEGAKSFVGSPNGKFAAIGYQLDKHGEGSTTRVVTSNLDSAKPAADAIQNGKYIVVAIHNDGNQVLVRKDESGKDRAEIWDVSGKSASKGIQWVPYDDAKGGDREISWGAFIGDDRMATMSNNGNLVIWELDGPKPIYSLHVQGGSKPAVSPDQKWLAFTTGKDVGILDLQKGEIAGLQSHAAVNWPNLAFSPGQSKLGMAAFDRLYVWDFATGELYREMPYEGLHVHGNITWPSEEHVLLGKNILIDLENQVRLWDYQGGEFAEQIGGMTWFVVSDGHQKPGAILGAQLPPPAVKDQLAKAMSAPDFFVLKPGTVVKIDVSKVDPAGKDFVEKALAARLKEAGFDSGPAGTIDLVASTEVGQPREISYHTFGRIGSQTYTVRDYTSRVKFVYKGADVWQTAVGNVPFHVRLAENETMEQFLRKSEKFNFDWFGKVGLPKLLQKPQGQGAATSQTPTVGTTKLTTGGAR